MEKNNQCQSPGFFRRFLEVLSAKYPFSFHRRRHIGDGSSVPDSKLLAFTYDGGDGGGATKDAATCNGESMNAIVLEEKEICVVPEKELLSNLEDEPYLVVRQDVSAVKMSIVEVNSGGDGDRVVTGKMTTTEGSKGVFDPHLKNEVIRNSSMEVEGMRDEEAITSNPNSTNASSGTTRTQSGVSEKPGLTSITESEAEAIPDFVEKNTKSKVEETADTKAKIFTLEGRENGVSGKSARQLRPRKVSSSNERSTGLIKRRKMTARGLVMEPTL